MSISFLCHNTILPQVCCDNLIQNSFRNINTQPDHKRCKKAIVAICSHAYAGGSSCIPMGAHVPLTPAYGFTVFSPQVIKTCRETHHCADNGSEEEKCKQANFKKNRLLQMIARLEMCLTCLLRPQGFTQCVNWVVANRNVIILLNQKIHSPLKALIMSVILPQTSQNTVSR